MYIKIIGALLIITCCGGYGMGLAGTYLTEVKLIRQLKQVVELMRGELEYKLTPIPQLCRLSAEHSGSILRCVFTTVADKLEKQELPDAAAAMAMALQEDKRLPPITATLLGSLGQTLGRFDLQGQLRGFSQCAEACARKLNELESEQQQRLRSYRTLGFCAGAALAILLF